MEYFQAVINPEQLNNEIPGLSWWEQLEPQWKQAFAETFFRHNNQPTPSELMGLFQAPALRFAGPSADYPNMSFELTNLSGIRQLKNLEVLVVIFHRIESIMEISSLVNLSALFLYNNQIKSIEGIESLSMLRQLYVHANRIESIEQVRGLRNLEELYISFNPISSLEGLTEEHSDKLETLVCKPNEWLRQKELMRVERELGIRCR